MQKLPSTELEPDEENELSTDGGGSLRAEAMVIHNCLFV